MVKLRKSELLQRLKNKEDFDYKGKNLETVKLKSLWSIGQQHIAAANLAVHNHNYQL